jgi:hypothetical protein
MPITKGRWPTNKRQRQLVAGMMQSIEEHQEVLTEDAAVMPVKGLRKRRRVWNPAAERRQKVKERTRGNSGSRRKLSATCRKVSRRAKVAWRKRNLMKKIRTLEKCGRRKEFAAAGIKTTAVQKWHGARNEVMKDRRSNKDDGRIKPEINLQVEPEKDGRSGRDFGWIRKAALV